MFDVMEAEWTTDLFFSYPEKELDAYDNNQYGQIKDIGYDS